MSGPGLASGAGAGACGRRCPGYDQGEGGRRWRALDLRTIQVVLEAEAPRVELPRARSHGRCRSVGPAWGRAHPRRGHKYLTIVVDHDSGRLIWAAPGRGKATLTKFFEALGPARCAQITHVSADGADSISWARRCRIPAFVTLQRRIVKHKPSILAAIERGLSNGRIESVNTTVRLITRTAFGFRSPEALIALALLSLGGHRPTLPGGN